MRFVASVVVLFAAIASILYLMAPRMPAYTSNVTLVPFASAAEFSSYLQESQSAFGTSYSYYNTFRSLMGSSQDAEIMVPSYYEEGAPEPGRVSGTNVQVTGIDEPDIVKTDGSEIYFSASGYREYWVMRSYYPYYETGETRVISAFPPENMTEEAQIGMNGDLLLYNGTLIILSYNSLSGYDVSDPASPQPVWTIELKGSIMAARLYSGKIYLVERSDVNTYLPCPIEIMSVDGAPVTVACTSVYHPITQVEVDEVYSASVIDPLSGAVEKTVSFVGSYGYSAVYMSESAIYVTYLIQQDYSTIYYNLIMEKFLDLLPSDVSDRITRVAGYDISIRAKLLEFQIIIDEYTSLLWSQDPVAYELFLNESEKRTDDYFTEHKREFTRTGITRVGLDMEVSAASSIPGTLLNQFSLDEYNGYLRAATTVGSWSDQSNDLYVLDGSLGQVGSIIDLGLDEQIYSARFIGDKGYLVTFRQTDPFFVLDLSDPANPQLAGELEIPGYSSYLHPIGAERILGVGMDDWKVKLSLFDVSSPGNPAEVSRYNLSDYWSDVMSTHHAFLLDSEHEVFFLPSGSSGYVFSYANDTLGVVKQVDGIEAKRAAYIDDYLYIVGESGIVVLDENTWEETSSLELQPTEK